MNRYNLNNINVYEYNQSFGIVCACLSNPMNVEKLEEIAKQGYHLFEENEYLGIPYLTLNELLYPQDLYKVVEVFSHFDDFLNKIDLANGNEIPYEIMRIQPSIYYLKTLKIILEKGMDIKVREEMLNRINYQFEDTYKDLYYMNFMEYCKYAYYSYLLVLAYIGDIRKAIRINKYKRGLDLSRFKTWDWYYIKIYLSDDKKYVSRVEVIDKNTEEIVLVMS